MGLAEISTPLMESTMTLELDWLAWMDKTNPVLGIVTCVLVVDAGGVVVVVVVVMQTDR